MYVNNIFENINILSLMITNNHHIRPRVEIFLKKELTAVVILVSSALIKVCFIFSQFCRFDLSLPLINIANNLAGQVPTVFYF